MMVKRIVDIGLTLVLLCAMAYQVTGEVAHEWIGIGMTVLVIFHQILNRRWYGALFKGKYNAYRIVQTVMVVALLVSFALTAFCGMSMSGHAVPFLYGIAPVSFSRMMHLSMTHWTFVLMGLHLGLHIPLMLAKYKLEKRIKIAITLLFCCVAGVGLFLFLKSGMVDYLLFKKVFAFLDYEKHVALVFLEHCGMLIFWIFIGSQIAVLCRKNKTSNKEKNQ